MKRLAGILFTLLCFHTHDGGPVWIVKEQVVAVDRFITPTTNSTIFLSSNNQFYVKETADEVAEKLK